MNYIKSFLQIVFCIIFTVSLTAFTAIFIFSLGFYKDSIMDYVKRPQYIAAQKQKLSNDLHSVALANNIDPTVFDGFIKDSMIIANNDDYLTNLLSSKIGKKPILHSAAADEYTKALKAELLVYKARIDPAEYTMTENGINTFVVLQRKTFVSSAVPLPGLDAIGKYINFVVDIKFVFLGFCLIGSGILLLMNLKNKIMALIYTLYYMSACGILLSAISGFMVWFFSSRTTILHSSYLKDVLVGIINNALLAGILIFVVSQISLFILHKRKDRRKAQEN